MFKFDSLPRVFIRCSMSNQLQIALIAHRADLKSASPEGKNWVDTLQRNMALRLQQLTACSVNVVVLEPQTDTDNQWNDTNSEPFDVLLPLYSTHFYHSDTAIRFTQQIQQNLSHSQTPCFALFRQPLDEASLPTAIQLHNRFHFWRKDPERERIQMFEPGNSETERFFWGKIDDCANEIYAHWLKKEGISEPNTAAHGHIQSEQVVVYLAECSADMSNYRDLLKRDLNDKGVLVLPETALPTQISEFNAALKPLLLQCDFSVHMLGTDYGSIPEGSNRSNVEIQNDLAEEWLSKEDKKRLLWVPEGIIPTDERQRILIDDAKTSMKSTGSAEVVVGVIEIFKSVVHETVNRIKFQKRKLFSSQESEKARPKLYVICDFHDREELLQMKNEVEELGCEMVFSAFEENETRMRRTHMDNLNHCEAVLFYFNHASDKWLKTRILEMQRVKAYGREQMDFAKAIGIGPKRKEWMTQLQNSDFALFDFNSELPKGDMAVWIQNWNNK